MKRTFDFWVNRNQLTGEFLGITLRIKKYRFNLHKMWEWRPKAFRFGFLNIYRFYKY